jgi:hypothetical protein
LGDGTPFLVAKLVTRALGENPGTSARNDLTITTWLMSRSPLVAICRAGDLLRVAKQLIARAAVSGGLAFGRMGQCH